MKRKPETYYVVRRTLHLDKKFNDYNTAYDFFKEHQYDLFKPVLIGFNLFLSGKNVKKVILEKPVKRNYIVLN